MLAERLGELSPEAGSRWDGGDLIREGVDADLDRHRQLTRDARGLLLDLERSLRDEMGIRGLKIGVHRTLGYFVEVPRRDEDRVPDRWRQTQSMAATVRFTMERLEELGRDIATAEERYLEADEARARSLAECVLEEAEALGQWADRIAQLDVFTTFADLAERRHLTRPAWSAGGIEAAGLRHPVVETTVPGYVPSDLVLEPPARTVVLTGPNMAGKSTFMRAAAQNAWLQHIGSFVAADRWRAPLLDAIFTRIGAGDNLARGQSTFMVEMEETAFILQHATSRSLVLLDELGRGTSTYDGLAIAWAVTEHLAREDGPYTLVATHYRELTDIDSPVIARLKVDALEHSGGQLVLLHEVTPGVASRSFGVAVAARAGLPRPVVTRASRLLRQWEAEGRPVPPPQLAQADWLEPDPREQDVLGEIRRATVDRLTPLDALALVAEWQRRLEP
jgi:DNA mismatch repair protein MutS